MNKKSLYLFLSFLTLFPLLLSAEDGEKGKKESFKQESNFQAFTGKIIGSKVRLRTAPNRESAIIRELMNGEMMGIVNEQNDFFSVVPPKEIKGYVFRKFVLDNVVEGEKVNIRQYPDIESPVIGKLHSGDTVNGSICSINNKWLEITLPEDVRFYVAKEYVENVGSFEMLAELEARNDEALHKLNSVFHFARGEIQKAFEEISFHVIREKFDALEKEYNDLPEVVQKSQEAKNLIEETYLQKKIAFLESKANPSIASRDVESAQIQKLSEMGRELKNKAGIPIQVGEVSETAAIATPSKEISFENATLWHSLEESFYHLWARANAGKTMEEFYEDSAKEAVFLTGIVEPYNRSVKNPPGNFFLKGEKTAFLYSTKIDLAQFVGKKVTLVSSPRPNNNFAFPAYFVLGVE